MPSSTIGIEHGRSSQTIGHGREDIILKARRSVPTSRERFQKFVQNNRSWADHLPVETLIAESGLPMSVPSAYRALRRMNVKGKRTNRSRYSGFWAKINWDLPNSDLSAIWHVDRGNILSKRRDLGKPAAKWAKDKYSRLEDMPAEYHAAVASEQRKSGRYRGPRPWGVNRLKDTAA
jgi:hypothetical protein